MTYDEIRLLLERIEFPEYTFHIDRDAATGRMRLKATYMEADILTGTFELQTTRKWDISKHALPSEVVQTAFKLVLTSYEHRAREHFRYRGELVFGPHFNVEDLVKLCREGKIAKRDKVPV